MLSYWKRAILYPMRKKGRTILLIVLLFVMSCLILIGLSLKSSADKEAERLRQSLGTGFILEADYQNESYYQIRDDTGYSYKAFTGPVVTDEMMDQILTIDGVSDYKLDLNVCVWTDLKLRPGMWAISEVHDGLSEEQLELFQKETVAVACRKGELDANFRSGPLQFQKDGIFRMGTALRQ